MSLTSFKIEILKQEIEIVAKGITHFDNLRHKTKQLVITLWVASLGFGLSQEVKWIVVLSLLVPLPFWYLEAIYHANQEGWICRFWAIRTFLREGKYAVAGKNVVRLKSCITADNFGDFPIPDYGGDKTLEQAVFLKETSIIRNFFKPKMTIFYLPLSLISFLTALMLNF